MQKYSLLVVQLNFLFHNIQIFLKLYYIFCCFLFSKYMLYCQLTWMETRKISEGKKILYSIFLHQTAYDFLKKNNNNNDILNMELWSSVLTLLPGSGLVWQTGRFVPVTQTPRCRGQLSRHRNWDKSLRSGKQEAGHNITSNTTLQELFSQNVLRLVFTLSDKIRLT